MAAKAKARGLSPEERRVVDAQVRENLADAVQRGQYPQIRIEEAERQEAHPAPSEHHHHPKAKSPDLDR